MSILNNKIKFLSNITINCFRYKNKFTYKSQLPCVSKLCYRNTSTTKASKNQTISLQSVNSKDNPKFELDFEDAKTAFQSKTNLELLRAYLVFQLCSVDFLVDNQKNVKNFNKYL